MESLGTGVLAFQADTRRLDESARFLKAAVERFGNIDVLFINAGIARFAPLSTESERCYDEHFDINVKGANFTLQKSNPASQRRSFCHPEHQRF